jgi:hypothetical protein
VPRGARYVSRKRLCIGGMGAPHLCAAGGLRECLAPWWLTCLASVSVQNRVQLPVGQAFRLLDARVREVRHYCSGASKGQGSSGPGGALQCRPVWAQVAQASARARMGWRLGISVLGLAMSCNDETRLTALGLEHKAIRAAWHRLWGWVYCTLPTPLPTASTLDSDAGVIPAGPASLDTLKVFVP